MGAPPTQIIADWTEAFIAGRSWLAMDECISGALSSNLQDWSEEKRWDLAEQSLPYVIQLLRDRIEQAYFDGADVGFEIDEEDPPYIRSVGTDYSEILAKLKRIDPFEFENVCAEILNAVGCSSERTQRSRDGGIDFVATGLDILPPSMNCPVGCRAAIIGQAKRYNSSQIAEKALREFVGASLLRRHELRVDKRIWPLSPVLLAFWTTSKFDPSGREFARNTGVWLMDGPTISSVIIKLGLADMVMALADEVLPETAVTQISN